MCAIFLPTSPYIFRHNPQVEPRTEECFYEDLKSGDKLTVNFEVIRGGLLDIEFKLKDPMGNVAYQRLAFFNHKYVNVAICFFKQDNA